MSSLAGTITRKSILDYRTVWRWHFYAGVFCIPLLIWLSITGSIYLFKPQIENWLDRPYENLVVAGSNVSADKQLRAAVAAVPGSSFHSYILPRTQQSAVRILVDRGQDEFRVYVHPQNLRILKVINEDHRPMNLISSLHGELLMGDRGSMIVELAASWAIVMLVTGLYLWWPKQSDKFAGVLYIRLRKGQRIFWRDLHAVTGVWVSALALFLILTGLPWASVWGRYLEKVRDLTHTSPAKQEWTTGSSLNLAQRTAINPTMPGMKMGPGAAMSSIAVDGDEYASIDRVIAVVAPLHLVDPVHLEPPASHGEPWTVEALPENRTLRTTLAVDGKTGAILMSQNFNQQQVIDRIVLTGVAVHTGQYFGLLNQLLGLFTAMGLVMLCISAVILWWRRRAVGVLGAPIPISRPQFSLVLLALVLAFSLYLPLLGASLFVVLLIERVLLRRIESVRVWLGLSA